MTPRDYSAMQIVSTDELSRCVVCGHFMLTSGFDAHVTVHLADGTAVVERDNGRERVVPAPRSGVNDGV